ncbi:hypothetical protein DL93DRAFT_2091944 [Clavulina sp. PMI_390]|nr:hypothetical protein DL93DRAFT_2091944 [Clavulina sp. PMI_390]
MRLVGLCPCCMHLSSPLASWAMMGFAGIVSGGGGLTTCLAVLATALIVPALFPCHAYNLYICLRRLVLLPHGLTR